MSIGSTVRTARENANMTIGELSDKTRLRPTLLSGIERDDFSTCGGNVYARGHLRTIATLIGLDANELVAQFDNAHAPSIESLEDSSRSFSEVSGTKSGLPWRRLSVIAGVAALSLLVWTIVPGFHAVTPSKPGSSIPQAVVSQSPSPVKGTDPPPTSAVATKPGTVSVTVTSSIATSWLAASNSSGTQLFRSMLYRGMSKTFTDAQQIYLTIGNAGGVEITVNGKNLGVPGGNLQILHLAFGPGSPTFG
jgi:cytoskeleton protein RodZ